MGILKSADDSPTFTTGDPLSPSALNVLRDNLVALDEATRLGGYAFTGLYGQHPEENAVQHWVIWRGGFVFVAGMTTLRIVTWTAGTVGGAVLRVYRGDSGANNALPATYNDVALSAGTQVHTITISDAGYTAGQAVRVQIELRHASPPAGASYTAATVDVVLVETLPVALAGWPGVPTFSGPGDITAANLNQLSAATDWLIARCGLRYDPLFILNIRRIGPFRLADGTVDPNVRWYGGLRRTTLHTTLVCRGRALRFWAGATEEIQLWISGAHVGTFSIPAGLGEHPWEIQTSLAGYSVDQVLALQLRYVRTAPSQDDTPINRWTVNEVLALPPTGGAATLAPWAVRQAGVSAASLVSWLTAARTLAQACYDRINANTGFWGVQRAFTARPASGEENFRKFEAWGVPATWRRAGEALVGRGRGLTIGYGSGYFDDSKGLTDIGAYPFTNLKTFQFLDGDNVETGQLFLDTVPGLPAGSSFNVRGEEAYILMERLKVVD